MTVKNRLTADQLAAREKKEKQIADKQAALRRDFSETFGSGAGRRVLRHLFEISGYDKSDVVADPANGKIFVETSVYNMAFRNFYRKIRSNVRVDILKDVEFHSEPEKMSMEVDIFS